MVIYEVIYEQKCKSSWLKALPFKYTFAKARHFCVYIQISHSKAIVVDR